MNAELPNVPAKKEGTSGSRPTGGSDGRQAVRLAVKEAWRCSIKKCKTNPEGQESQCIISGMGAKMSLRVPFLGPLKIKIFAGRAHPSTRVAQALIKPERRLSNSSA